MPDGSEKDPLGFNIDYNSQIEQKCKEEVIGFLKNSVGFFSCTINHKLHLQTRGGFTAGVAGVVCHGFWDSVIMYAQQEKLKLYNAYQSLQPPLEADGPQIP